MLKKKGMQATLDGKTQTDGTDVKTKALPTLK